MVAPTRKWHRTGGQRTNSQQNQIVPKGNKQNSKTNAKKYQTQETDALLVVANSHKSQAGDRFVCVFSHMQMHVFHTFLLWMTFRGWFLSYAQLRDQLMFVSTSSSRCPSSTSPVGEECPFWAIHSTHDPSRCFAGRSPVGFPDETAEAYEDAIRKMLEVRAGACHGIRICMALQLRKKYTSKDM